MEARFNVQAVVGLRDGGAWGGLRRATRKVRPPHGEEVAAGCGRGAWAGVVLSGGDPSGIGGAPGLVFIGPVDQILCMATADKFHLTFDAADPSALGEFWCAALGYRREDPPPPHQTWDEALTAWGLPRERWNDANAIVDPDGYGPRIYIQKVPEPKTAKNRVHLDVIVSTDRANKDEVAMHRRADELVELGASRITTFDDPVSGFWIVMQDPEGNEFCIV